MNRAATGIAVCTSALSLAIGGINTAAAQSGQGAKGSGRSNLPTPALTLLKTKIVEGNGTLSLTAALQNAFDQVRIRCPNREDSCTLRVEITSQFRNTDSTARAAIMSILVDDSNEDIRPSSTAFVNNVAGTIPNASTFTFVKNVAPGLHTIDAKFRQFAGTGAQAGSRTMTVSLFAP